MDVTEILMNLVQRVSFCYIKLQTPLPLFIVNCGNMNFSATFQNFKYQILVSVNKRMIIQLQASLGFFTEFYIAKYFTNKKSFNSKHGYIQVFFLCIASCKGTFTDNGRVTADVNVDGWWKKSKTAPHWR